MLQTYARELAVIESRYGVERHAVVAIWGMETNYGNFMGKHYVVRALATLAYAARRAGASSGSARLVTALQILDAGHVAPDRMEGPGPAPWATPSSCLPAGSSMRPTMTATAGATSGPTFPMRLPPPPTT